MTLKQRYPQYKKEARANCKKRDMNKAKIVNQNQQIKVRKNNMYSPFNFKISINSFIILGTVLVGCSAPIDDSSKPNKQASSTSDHNHHDHGRDHNDSDHDHHDHGHHDHDHDHDHHDHEPPHGGTLTAIGDGVAYLEFVFETDTAKLTMYAFDDELESSIRFSEEEINVLITPEGSNQTFEVKLNGVANDLSGEMPGDTSEFSGTSEELKGVEHFDLELTSLMVNGTAYEHIHLNMFEHTQHKHTEETQ